MTDDPCFVLYFKSFQAHQYVVQKKGKRFHFMKPFFLTHKIVYPILRHFKRKKLNIAGFFLPWCDGWWVLIRDSRVLFVMVTEASEKQMHMDLEILVR
jgi:hypothetical protein